jgi:hypothetical protein
VLGFIAEVRDRTRRVRTIAAAFPRGTRDGAFRKLLKCDLYDYQREGALFAASAGRSLVGDEMGLGKTVEALAAVEIMAQQFGVERVLIVCPTSLKHQWEREISRFTSRQATVVGGLRTRREQQYRSASTFFTITNYDTVHADLDFIAGWSPGEGLDVGDLVGAVRLEETLEPGGAGLGVGRRTCDQRNERRERAVHGGADRARRTVDVLERRREPLDEGRLGQESAGLLSWDDGSLVV